MKKLLTILFCLFVFFSVGNNNETIFGVTDSTTAFGRRIPAGKLVLDQNLLLLYKITATASATQKLSNTTKTQMFVSSGSSFDSIYDVSKSVWVKNKGSIGYPVATSDILTYASPDSIANTEKIRDAIFRTQKWATSVHLVRNSASTDTTFYGVTACDSAATHAVAGDFVYVNAGTYTKKILGDRGWGVSDVDWFFYPNSHVSSSVAGWIFYWDAVKEGNVFGYGNFTTSGSCSGVFRDKAGAVVSRTWEFNDMTITAGNGMRTYGYTTTYNVNGNSAVTTSGSVYANTSSGSVYFNVKHMDSDAASPISIGSDNQRFFITGNYINNDGGYGILNTTNNNNLIVNCNYVNSIGIDGNSDYILNVNNIDELDIITSTNTAVIRHTGNIGILDIGNSVSSNDIHLDKVGVMDESRSNFYRNKIIINDIQKFDFTSRMYENDITFLNIDSLILQAETPANRFDENTFNAYNLRYFAITKGVAAVQMDESNVYNFTMIPQGAGINIDEPGTYNIEILSNDTITAPLIIDGARSGDGQNTIVNITGKGTFRGDKPFIDVGDSAIVTINGDFTNTADTCIVKVSAICSLWIESTNRFTCLSNTANATGVHYGANCLNKHGGFTYITNSSGKAAVVGTGVTVSNQNLEPYYNNYAIDATAGTWTNLNAARGSVEVTSSSYLNFK